VKLTVQDIQTYLDTHDDGVLSAGSHQPGDRAYCALECINALRGHDWTDAPDKAGMPDVRPINDGPWSSSKRRTDAMLPMLAALSDWAAWKQDEQRRWAEHVALRTVRELISELSALPDKVRQPCRQAATLAAAEAAATTAANAADAAAHAAADAAAELAAAEAAATTAANAADAAAAAAEAAAAAAAAARAAVRAARAARAAAVHAAAAAADAARAAAAADAADAVLIRACRIWQEEAEAIEASREVGP
jgi:hypothetical protein